MQDPNKSFFDKEVTEQPPTEEDTATPADGSTPAPEGEESQVRIPRSPSDPPLQGGGESLALFSLVLAIASFVCCGLPASIGAIIAALASRRRMKRFCGTSLAGLICGIISVLITVLLLVLVLVLAEIVEEALGEMPEGALLALFCLG